MLLLDAGVWVSSGSGSDRFHSAAAALVREHQGVLAALDLTLFEVANVVGARRGEPRNAEKLARLIVGCCAGRRLQRVDADLVGAAVDVAAEHGLTAYDAAYVAVSRLNGWQLVSTDIRDLVSRGLALTPDAAV